MAATQEYSVAQHEHAALTELRRKFKASELPLNASQRSAIDGLVSTIKKRGEFDRLRKKLWAEYTDSVSIS